MEGNRGRWARAVSRPTELAEARGSGGGGEDDGGDAGGDDGGGGEEEGGGRFVEEEEGHDAGEDELAGVAEADDLAADVAEGMVEKRVADDRWENRETGEERPFAERGVGEGVEPGERGDEAEEAGLEVDGDDVEPERGEVAVGAAEREIPSEEKHGDEADDVAEEVAAAGEGVVGVEEKEAGDGDGGADEFDAVDFLADERMQEERDGDGDEVDDEGGLSGVGGAGAVGPGDEVQGEDEGGEGGATKMGGGVGGAVATEVEEEEGRKGEDGEEEARGRDDAGVGFAGLDQDDGRGAAEYAEEQEQVAPGHERAKVIGELPESSAGRTE